MSSIDVAFGLDRLGSLKSTGRLLCRAGKPALAVATLALIVAVPIALRAWLAFGHVH